MKKIFIVITSLLLVTCTPMDDKYKDFVKDGPLVYLSKVDNKALKVIGERERVNFQWPTLTDPRGKKAVIYWASRSQKFETDFNPATATSIYVSPLAEGSYIFELYFVDNDGNTSIPISVSGYAYGRMYESYLINRRVIENTVSGNDRLITLSESFDKTMLGTEFEWMDTDKKTYSGYINASELKGTLKAFKAFSFRYRTQYIPEGGVDVFNAPWEFYLENAKPADVKYDFGSKKFTFPKPDDGYWVGYELSWIDKTTNAARSYRITGNEAVISDYNGREFTYSAVYNMGGQQVMSATNSLLTASYIDLNRSKWYAAPETDLNGNPIPDVNFGPSPPTASAATGNTITNKLKSPYLSHMLPWANAALSATSGDGVNNPSAHFDNKSDTYLSMVKGIGVDATNSNTTVHVNGGVVISAVGEKPWFIIRLDETTPQKFNYFRMRYRENGSNGSALKPQGVTFFGSNDDACITDDSKWTQINTQPIVPPGSTANSTQPPAANVGNFATGANLESGNVMLPRVCEYRYIKMRYDLWESGSNTMQIAEFYLGFSD